MPKATKKATKASKPKTTKKTKTVKKTKASKTTKTTKAVKKTVKATAPIKQTPEVKPTVETSPTADKPEEPTPPTATELSATPLEPTKNDKPVKKTKPSKPPVKSTGKNWTLPDPPVHTNQIPDTGWRNYRLWTVYELDYDDKATDETTILASIKSHFTKNKTKLAKALEAFDQKQLIVKTDLKKDTHPFEPFIEAWISLADESQVRGKLLELEEVSIVDPDYQMDIKPTVKKTKTVKATKPTTQEAVQ